MRFAAFVVLMLGTVAAATAQTRPDPYFLPHDPVSETPLASVEVPVIVVHDDREIRFASQANVDLFLSDPDTYLPAIDAAMIEDQVPFYPLATCPIGGGELESMGGPVNYLHGNRLVRFCCAGCINPFKADPEPTLVALDAAIVAAQVPTFADAVCPVSGQALGSMGEPVDLVIGNRLVRLCCGGCTARFLANPQAYYGELPSPPGAEAEPAETEHSDHAH